MKIEKEECKPAASTQGAMRQFFSRHPSFKSAAVVAIGIAALAIASPKAGQASAYGQKPIMQEDSLSIYKTELAGLKEATSRDSTILRAYVDGKVERRDVEANGQTITNWHLEGFGYVPEMGKVQERFFGACDRRYDVEKNVERLENAQQNQ